MKTSSGNAAAFESTYGLIMRSEEKQRNRLEMLVYALLLASGLLAVSQFCLSEFGASRITTRVATSTAEATRASR